jgi:hypothetical protein
VIVLEHGWHCCGRMKPEVTLAPIKSSAQACTTPNSHLRWPYRFSCAMCLDLQLRRIPTTAGHLRSGTALSASCDHSREFGMWKLCLTLAEAEALFQLVISVNHETLNFSFSGRSVNLRVRNTNDCWRFLGLDVVIWRSEVDE